MCPRPPNTSIDLSFRAIVFSKISRVIGCAGSLLLSSFVLWLYTALLLLWLNRTPVMNAYPCIVLSILAYIESAQAFQHYDGLRPSFHIPSVIVRSPVKISPCPSHVSTNKQRSSIRHLLIILSNQNDDTNDGETSTEEKTDNTPQSPSSSNGRKTLLAQITYAIFNIFSYTIQFLGVLLTLGLILNLFGYGYRFDAGNGGLEINKLEYMRNEIQFEREIVREEKEDFYLKRGVEVDSSGGGFNQRSIVFGNWGKSVLGK